MDLHSTFATQSVIVADDGPAFIADVRKMATAIKQNAVDIIKRVADF